MDSTGWFTIYFVEAISKPMYHKLSASCPMTILGAGVQNGEHALAVLAIFQAYGGAHDVSQILSAENSAVLVPGGSIETLYNVS